MFRVELRKPISRLQTARPTNLLLLLPYLDIETPCSKHEIQFSFVRVEFRMRQKYLTVFEMK
jgi:hypothetical protein